MGFYRRFSNCNYLAFVADFDFCLSILTFFWCRESHSYGSHHRNCDHQHYAKNRDVAAHTNHASSYRRDCAIALGSTITLKGPLPVPWLTLARNSVTNGATPRICHVAIYWNIEDIRLRSLLAQQLRTNPLLSFDPVTILQRALSGVCGPSGKANLRSQAYIACSEQTGHGFSAGVCR